MTNSQPAVACGYGAAWQEISNIQGKYTRKFDRLEIPCWILDIQSPRQTRWNLRH
jgi:glutathione peroxidase-family protein